MPAPLAAAAGAAAKHVARKAARKYGPKVVMGCLATVMIVVGALGDFMTKAKAEGDRNAAAAAVAAYMAPSGVAKAAKDAQAKTGTDARLLLAIAYIESRYGRAQVTAGEAATAEAMLPEYIRSSINTSKLAAGAETPGVIGQPTRTIAVGDWVNPQPVTLFDAAAGVSQQHAMGFMQFIPTTWTEYSARGAAALGHAADPYVPADALMMAGLKVAADTKAAGGDIDKGLSAYGDETVAQIRRIAPLTLATPGHPLVCDHPALTQGYGPVSLGLEPAMRGAAHYHSGADLACPMGTQVVTVTDGIAHVHPNLPGWGNVVSVDSGGYHVRYCHLAAIVATEGQEVHVGDVLGLEGSTGASTGAHLHFELDQGRDTTGADYVNAVSPFVLLDSAGVSPIAGLEGSTW